MKFRMPRFVQTATLLMAAVILFGSPLRAQDAEQLDYLKLTEGHEQLAAILQNGEQEWMRNAREKYGERTERVWRKSIVDKVVSAEITARTRKLIERYTPEMLTAMAGLSRDGKYDILASIGQLFLLRALEPK